MSRGSRSPSLRPSLIAAQALISLFLVVPSARPEPPTDPFAALQVQPFQEIVPAPALSLEGVDGRPLRLEDLRGKVVFLNFWATWCVPCRQEMPTMERLYRDYRESGLAVVAVNFKEAKGEVKRFFEEFHLNFPAVLDSEGNAARAYAVRALPVTFLLSRDGLILWRAIGSRDWDSPDSRAYFKQVLQRTQP